MKDAGAVAGAAHARVRQPHHVAHALLHEFCGDRQHAPFRHPRPALRARVAQDQHVIGRHVEIGIVDRLLHRGIVVEHQREPGMLEETRLAGARLDHAAVRREIALQHRERALLVDRVRDGADHVIIVDLGTRDIFAERLAGHRQTVEMKMLPDPAHQAGQAAGIEEILHQIFVAGGPHIGDHRHLAARLLEIVEPDVLSGAAGLCDQMNDGVGRTAHRHRDRDGVLEGLSGLNPFRRQILPHHLDDAPAAFGSHSDVAGIRGRYRGGARQRHADRFGDRGHGRGGAHGHAGAVAAGDAGLDVDPVLVGDFPGTAFVPVFPGIRSRAQRLAFPVAAQHRPRRQIDRGDVHAGRAQQQRRRGLVAAAHQHHAVDGMAAQQFLRVHCQQIAVEHGGRLQQRFRQRQRRQFDRKAAGHQDAALDVVDAGFEMHVAGLRVGPGVEDRDQRPILPLFRRVAHLHGAGAVTEGSEIVGRKPARAAQRLRRFLDGFFRHRDTRCRPFQVISQAVPAEQAPAPALWSGEPLHRLCSAAPCLGHRSHHATLTELRWPSWRPLGIQTGTVSFVELDSGVRREQWLSFH